jgi:ATP-dependent exoDNAse (exonuclease V) beta subunit
MHLSLDTMHSSHKHSCDMMLQVPERVYQLTHNYRSHAGILRVANSVVDLLLEFFPQSLDKLAPDCALFEGPRPVVLQGHNMADLEEVLTVEDADPAASPSPPEFGAHQAIIVADSPARDRLERHSKLFQEALIITVFEAKGLEFDDVLLFNFFSRSPVRATQSTKQIKHIQHIPPILTIL